MLSIKQFYYLIEQAPHVKFRLIFLSLLLFLSPFFGYCQSGQQKGQTIDIENKSEIIHNLTTHQSGATQTERSYSQEKKKSSKRQDLNSDDLIEKNERLTREKPKDQAYRKIELVDIQKNQLKSLKRQMATHRTNGKTVYVKEEVVEKLEQLTEEGITNVNLADSGIVSLSVAEKALERDKPISRNSSANTLATFMVEKDGKGNKIYRITKDGKYEYKDDKKIVGGDKYHKIFKDGFKPITPKTFYYELSNQSHIDLTDDQIQTFLSLPVDKQVEMIKKGIKKSSDYVQLDELSVNANKTSEDQSTN